MGELFYNEEEEDSDLSDEGEEDEEDPDPASEEHPSPADRGGRKKPPRKPRRLSLVNTGLEEREVVVGPTDPETYINPKTGEPYEILRYEETRRLAEEPAKLLVIIEKRPIYIKEIDPETGETTLITTPVPDNHPIDRCKGGCEPAGLDFDLQIHVAFAPVSVAGDFSCQKRHLDSEEHDVRLGHRLCSCA